MLTIWPSIRIVMLASFFLTLSFSVITGNAADSILRMATTTSTANSGLMDYLLPEFTKKTAIEVQIIAVGTGKALRLGQEGDVDIVLVHARRAEQAFIDAGFGVERFDVMYNDFILVGPPDDPAQISSSQSITEVLEKIHDTKSAFISRGDDVGQISHGVAIVCFESQYFTGDLEGCLMLCVVPDVSQCIPAMRLTDQQPGFD